ncbi:terpenoid synthase [Penicillium cinerascens]|uniref:Terpenoid synthase n=1 Tax=Penicillium cinerascens TaxID=70096 RepID=A0A9W9M682_9EURO|nr:terpenoid synthase [Penicillium cinerascens]KAJ5190254.1 terpenoid synthase [Penicillium cinerascens]
MAIFSSETRLFRRRTATAKVQCSMTISKAYPHSEALSPIKPSPLRDSEEKTAVGDSSPNEFLRSSSSSNPENNESRLDDSAVSAPCDYIRSLASKNVRGKVIQACNVWFNLSEHLTTVIIEIVSDLHNASLILDDIQDDSLLRRGSPATHCIFGNAQAINSATFMIMNTCLKLQNLQLSDPAPMEALLKGSIELFVGQSWDLKWKFHIHCPSVEEYMAMVDGKTGAMLKVIIYLMHSMSDQRHNNSVIALFDRLVVLLGRFYQLRDDYQNLQDDTYTEHKGFCEDLDEGKLSYPIIVCCDFDHVARDIILGIFREKRNPAMSALPRNTKIYILGLIELSGAFQATWELLQSLNKETCMALSALEEATGKSNPALRQMVKMLITTVQPPKAR